MVHIDTICFSLQLCFMVICVSFKGKGRSVCTNATYCRASSCWFYCQVCAESLPASLVCGEGHRTMQSKCLARGCSHSLGKLSADVTSPMCGVEVRVKRQGSATSRLCSYPDMSRQSHRFICVCVYIFCLCLCVCVYICS